MCQNITKELFERIQAGKTIIICKECNNKYFGRWPKFSSNIVRTEHAKGIKPKGNIF